VITDSLTLVALIGWMLWLSWQFTLLVLVVGPVIGWVMRGINRRFRRHSARIQQSMGDVTRVAKEAIEGHRVIKVFTAEGSQQRRFEEVNEHNRRSNVRLINAKAMSVPVVQMVAALALASVLAVAINEVNQHQVGVDDFISYIGAMMMVMGPRGGWSTSAVNCSRASPRGASLFECWTATGSPGAVAGHYSAQRLR
jgi:subfamily B ATP-binding cassette protein MsbA